MKQSKLIKKLRELPEEERELLIKQELKVIEGKKAIDEGIKAIDEGIKAGVGFIRDYNNFHTMTLKDYFREMSELQAVNFNLNKELKEKNSSEYDRKRKLELDKAKRQLQAEKDKNEALYELINELEKPKPTDFIIGCVISNENDKYTEDELATLFVKWCKKIHVKCAGHVNKVNLNR